MPLLPLSFPKKVVLKIKSTSNKGPFDNHRAGATCNYDSGIITPLTTEIPYLAATKYLHIYNGEYLKWVSVCRIVGIRTHTEVQSHCMGSRTNHTQIPVHLGQNQVFIACVRPQVRPGVPHVKSGTISICLARDTLSSPAFDGNRATESY